MFLFNSFKYIYQTALHIACQNDNVEIVELLLSNRKIDITIKNSI